MAATASKLGLAPITVDWSGLSRIAKADRETFESTWKKLYHRFETGEVGFFHAPSANQLSQAQESQKLAEQLLKQGVFKDCLFLGIGGSALGPISLLSALQEKCTSGMRFHFVENIDPVEWRSTLEKLNPQSTLVCAVTKSGTTFETCAQFLLVLEWLGQPRWKTHIVAITDPQKGDLRSFVNQQGIPSLSIAPSIGGRFSIFSPVGLFPAALAGLSVPLFLSGAQQIKEMIEKTPLEKNPLWIIGHELIQKFPKHSIHVCMPYSTRLRLFGDWFVQLWGESLGKDGKGFTPVAALGATDQHSLLQLLRDGPDDKVSLFIHVEQAGDAVSIPKTGPFLPLLRPFQAFSRLQGHSLNDLLRIEYQATSLVLTRRNRPHWSLQLDRLDERSMGALYFAFSTLTAFTGTLWDVNPFDQPGVEEGKQYIIQKLGETYS